MKFEKLYQLVNLFLNTFILSTIGSAVRALIKPMDTIRQTFGLFVGSSLLGVLVGAIAHKSVLSLWIQYAIVGSTGCFAKELIEFGQSVARDPFAFWLRVKGIKTDDSEKELKK